jgi:hypothetical protein
MLTIFASLMVNAQVKTISLPTLNTEGDRSFSWNYTGVVSDTISTNQDTIQVAIFLNKTFPVNYYLKSVLTPRAGAYSLIETVTTSAISAATTVTIESITDADFTLSIAGGTDTFNADSTTTVSSKAITLTPSIKPTYRYLMVEYIIKGNDTVGTGIKLTSLKGYIQKVQ